MVGIAVVFGLLAVFVAQGWLNYQAELSRKTAAPKPQQVATRTIVVAAAPLRFGTHVSADNLREVAWPDDAIPAGTFGSIAELTAGGKRIVLASIERNEPILRTKITGPGTEGDALGGDPGRHARRHGARQRRRRRRAASCCRATMSTCCSRASHERTNGMNDVVIQNARVLAVDQLADDAADRPTVVQGGHARSRHRRGAEDRARGLARQSLADAAPRRRAGTWTRRGASPRAI